LVRFTLGCHQIYQISERFTTQDFKSEYNAPIVALEVLKQNYYDSNCYSQNEKIISLTFRTDIDGFNAVVRWNEKKGSGNLDRRRITAWNVCRTVEI
jgi:hypothetical protein